MMIDIKKCENPRYIFTSVPVSGTPHYWRENGRVKMQFDGTYARVPVVCPCGRCEGCRVNKQREWQSRITREMVQGNGNGALTFFCTLTFDNALADLLGCNPQNCSSADGKRIYREYVQLFFKRLRAKRGGGLKFRYFTVCEFGSDFGRLHFHFIMTVFNPEVIYNTDYWLRFRNIDKHYVRDNKNRCERLQTDIERAFQHLFERYWTVPEKGAYPCARVERYYDTVRLRSASRVVWEHTVPLGFVEKNELCDCGSASYVTKYVNKVTEDMVQHKEPFHRQSQGLGLLDLVDALQTLDLKKCRQFINSRTVQTTGKYFMKIPKYYMKRLRMLTFTYLEHCREFVSKSIGYARDSLRVGIGIPFLDGDRRVLSVADIEYYTHEPYYEYGCSIPRWIDSNSERSNERFLQAQFFNSGASRLWGNAPLQKRCICGIDTILLQNYWKY